MCIRDSAYTYRKQGEFALQNKPEPVLTHAGDAVVRVTMSVSYTHLDVYKRQAQLSAEVQQKRLPPGQGEPPVRFKYPAGSVQKRSRPSGANTLTQFVCPAESVPRKKENPLTKVL